MSGLTRELEQGVQGEEARLSDAPENSASIAHEAQAPKRRLAGKKPRGKENFKFSMRANEQSRSRKKKLLKASLEVSRANNQLEPEAAGDRVIKKTKFFEDKRVG